MSSMDRILVIGATGFMGQFVTKEILNLGRPTYLLLRPGSITPSKAAIVKSFQDKGATLIHGVINDKEFMEKIMKEYNIDIVVSLVGGGNLLDQLALVEAIKSVKTIKRFLPSEFGHDVERANPVEPAYFVDGNDIGKFTMKAIDDIRTLNKIVHFRPSSNCYSINELASLWEKKIGRTIPRITISEHDLLATAAENRIPESVVASFTHDIFIKGCQVNFNTDGPKDVEISILYPDEKFRSLEDCFEDFLPMVHQ
ncbi:unnamed protein product [Lupinus luteus]|uniref:NmrA-like domain-containing protein n=1 Tax=Lupinus luteus TaxID=3873 RepID=A0AAV1X1A8_LUPLU